MRTRIPDHCQHFGIRRPTPQGRSSAYRQHLVHGSGAPPNYGPLAELFMAHDLP